LVGMNDRDPQWHDLYRVDLASGERSLVERNSDRIGEYVADADYRLRFATRSREDGGIDLLRREGDAWAEYDGIPFEDGLTTGYAGLSKDGATLYMRDSRDRNTNALFAIDTATGERSLVHEDPRVDIGRALADPATGEVQAVAANYLREEWNVGHSATPPPWSRSTPRPAGAAWCTGTRAWTSVARGPIRPPARCRRSRPTTCARNGTWWTKRSAPTWSGSPPSVRAKPRSTPAPST